MVPTANRGLKSHQAPEVAHIDFLTITAPLAQCAVRVSEFGGRVREAAENVRAGHETSVALGTFWFLFGDTALKLDEEVRGFRNFYERHCRIVTPEGEQCGFVAWGGQRQRDTLCIELTGAGCAHVKAWAHARDRLHAISARITRIDVAHDDFAGTHHLEHAREWYAAGAFTTNGRPPALQEMGWNDESGRTIYIGKNAGNQQLCVYEKGKQQGDAHSPWVRWEARFGSKYRDIPLSILTEAAAFMVGHFPALAWISEASTRMRTSVERLKANAERAMLHCRRQYGALLNLLRQNTSDVTAFGERVAKLCRERIPRWSASVPFASDAIPQAFANT